MVPSALDNAEHLRAAAARAVLTSFAVVWGLYGLPTETCRMGTSFVESVLEAPVERMRAAALAHAAAQLLSHPPGWDSFFF